MPILKSKNMETTVLGSEGGRIENLNEDEEPPKKKRRVDEEKVY